MFTSAYQAVFFGIDGLSEMDISHGFDVGTFRLWPLVLLGPGTTTVSGWGRRGRSVEVGRSYNARGHLKSSSRGLG